MKKVSLSVLLFTAHYDIVSGYSLYEKVYPGLQRLKVFSFFSELATYVICMWNVFALALLRWVK